MFALEHFPQAKNGVSEPLGRFEKKSDIPASWPKRVGYDQKKTSRIFT
jgi:hypothetical protein